MKPSPLLVIFATTEKSIGNNCRGSNIDWRSSHAGSIMAHMNTRTRTAHLVAEPDADLETPTPLRAAPAAKQNPRLRRGRYISDSILERRRRMLEVAKRMIAEGGRDGFTIRELGRRASVSVTTVYATDGDNV